MILSVATRVVCVVGAERQFQSTPACERATVVVGQWTEEAEKFQSTPACERATGRDRYWLA